MKISPYSFLLFIYSLPVDSNLLKLNCKNNLFKISFSINKLKCWEFKLTISRLSPSLDVLISQISNQIDLNFEVGDNASLIINFGIERIIGNHITDLGDNTDPSGSPINMILNSLNSSNSIVNFARNQRNRLIGLGLDYKIGKGAMIFFRHNLYSYHDPNFVLNNLKGSETMLELKILFWWWKTIDCYY